MMPKPRQKPTEAEEAAYQRTFDRFLAEMGADAFVGIAIHGDDSAALIGRSNAELSEAQQDMFEHIAACLATFLGTYGRLDEESLIVKKVCPSGTTH